MKITPSSRKKNTLKKKEKKDDFSAVNINPIRILNRQCPATIFANSRTLILRIRKV
jgi:hypothetical protein